MIDLTKHEWKNFTGNSLPNPDIERNIVVINPDATYIDICDIFIDNGIVKIAIYNNIFNEMQILSITNIRLKNLRWDYIKVNKDDK